MNVIKKLVAVVLLFTICGSLTAQNLSNKGKDFWVGYGHHQGMSSAGGGVQDMVLYISAEQAAVVTVNIDGTAWTQTYNVPANTVIQTAVIPKTGAYDARLYTGNCGFVTPPCNSEGLFTNKAIHITSDVPVVVYAHIYAQTNSGATMLMPVETWGQSYYTINSRQYYDVNCYSWAYVIAEKDNTVVEITPTATTRNGRAAGAPFTVTLNRGQIYQILAGPETQGTVTAYNSLTATSGTFTGKPDLTGTRVRSIANDDGDCFPIAVFSGSSRTYNPMWCGGASPTSTGGGDNDNQQCFPSQAWGKKYLTSPSVGSATTTTNRTDGFKIMVKDPTTVVKRNGVIFPASTLIGGTHYYYESSTADYIEADKPITVAQFFNGGNCMTGGTSGDPEMIYISPIAQGIKRIGFFRNNLTNISVNFLNVIIPTAGLTSLRIDGSPTWDRTYAHPNLPGYSVAVKKWTAAQQQGTAYSDSAFTAITYGYGGAESYGFNAGTLINNLEVKGAVRNNPDTSTTTTHPYSCVGTPFTLSVLVAYQPTVLSWLLAEANPAIITPNTNSTQVNPTSVRDTIIDGVTYYQYNAPGQYQFTDTGLVEIPVMLTHPSIDNCNNTTKVKIYIRGKEKPKADFFYTLPSCMTDSVFFHGDDTLTNQMPNPYIVSQWHWTFSSAAPPSSSQDTFVVFNSQGPHTAFLHITTREGCISDTSKTFTLAPAPANTLAANPLSGCVGTSVTFTPSTNYTGPGNLGSHYWNFGDGTIITNAPAGPQTHTFNTPGTFNVKYTNGLTGGCKGDTAYRTITVYAKPLASFTYPQGCLPADGVVQFTSAATTPDGQTITGHAWTFGDPASGANNTSTAQNPSHTYPAYGTYTITYTVTTANGCVDDTTVNAQLNLKPVLAYPALNAVCESATTVNIGTASVTNSVPGAGVYNGPGTTIAGVFNPATAGPGTHTIWYVYTAASGCKDSISQTITVNQKASANFTLTNATCLPLSGTVPFTYSGNPVAGQTYTWGFGDPSSGANNSSTQQNPSHNYSTSGTYTITLNVTTPAGCTKDTSLTTTFNMTPDISYPALTAVCESATPVSVGSAVVNNGVTGGTWTYSGPGTTAAGVLNPATAGPGTHTIQAIYASAAGCRDTATQTILVNQKASANFTMASATCLPLSGTVPFTYSGNSVAGQTYTWGFGDPASGANNSSTQQNPSHNYATSGSYTITLNVTTPAGCSKDTSLTTTFNMTPDISYPALSPICGNAASTNVATATVNNGVTGGTWTYSGPGTTSAGVFNPVTAGPGVHTIQVIYASTAGCRDTATQTIGVSQAPLSSFTIPSTQCLPLDGNVQFTFNGSAIAGQTYAWNFGDNGSGANNTSTQQSPVHSYSTSGTYPIVLTVTTPAGCTDDTTVNATFNATPVANYPALNAVCQNASPLTVNTATVTNGVTPGTWVYSGPGTSANGSFNPATAGAGTHTLTGTYTSSAGCTTTVTQSITVNAIPQALISVANNSVCQGSPISFTDASSSTVSTITGWNWNFGDGGNGNTGGTFTHAYNNTGTYTASLIVTDANGCSSNADTANVYIRSNPVASFNMPASVCMPNGVATFSSTSTNADGSAMTYNWQFGDGGTANTATANHTYPSMGTYQVTLTVSSAWGCVDDSIRTFDAFFDKPVAAFTVSDDTLCQNVPATFTSSSFAPNNSINSHHWNFGDGTTSNAPNPRKAFANPGRYIVSLIVVSKEGCTSDTFRKEIMVYVQPQVDAGKSFYVAEGTTIQFEATVNDPSLTFTWIPSGGLSNAHALNPYHYANGPRTYTLLVTGNGGCTAQDSLSVNIYRPIDIPNAFSPNGDGTNDKWEITNLTDYPGATMEVFNRWGQMVWRSGAGYAKAWDGTYRGNALPVGVYYYVLDLKNGDKPRSGSVTLIR